MKEYKCVICGKKDIFVTEGGTIVEFYIAPQTKEVLCGRCNQVNDWIAINYYKDLRKGKLNIRKIK